MAKQVSTDQIRVFIRAYEARIRELPRKSYLRAAYRRTLNDFRLKLKLGLYA